MPSRPAANRRQVVEARRGERTITRDGEELFVRPISPDDRVAYLREFERLSEETRYRRFLAPIKQLADSEVTYFTDVDHRDHEALIALTGEGEIVGVARYIRLGAGAEVAEVAVTVVDAWQGRGVGTALLHRIAQRGRHAGVRAFRGVCLTENTDMQQLLRELGPDAKTSHPEPGLVEVEVRLPESDDTYGPVAPALRAAARGHHRANST
jgi:RimJ/RimL family protein N-acetyltransferase